MSIQFRYEPPEEQKETAKPILEEGWYEFIVEEAYESKDGHPLITKHGDPYIQLRTLEKESGVSIYHSLFFSEMGVPKVNAFLFATGTKLEAGEETEIKAEKFIGNKFRGKVEITTYEGKKYNKIIRVSPIEIEDDLNF
tara:strand:- start:1215 stop:1631 length:417 start_codon:yes stop_codon:yes gene_type:complete